MTEIQRHRIKFYSKENLATGYELSKAENLFENYNQEHELTLLDLFEFYNIKKYFDNQLFLVKWNGQEKQLYIKIIEQVFKKLKDRLLIIDDTTLESELNQLEYEYYDDFWSLVNNLNIYKNISEKVFAELLKKNQQQIYNILKEKRLVEKFDKAVRAFLMTYDNSAKIILSNTEEKGNVINKETYYFPKSLSLEDKEQIINDFLNTKEPNLNYVRLIKNSKDTSEFKINAKTRLKAKQKSEELSNKILKNENSWEIGISISFSKEQIEPVKYSYENTDLEVISFSEKFIDQFSDNINLFLIFKFLFCYVDQTNLIALVSKQSELSVLERVSMKSKNEYVTGFSFHRKENLASLMLFVYKQYLHRKDNSIESLINSYIDFINNKIKPHKILFQIVSTKTSYLEKIRNVAPAFEFLLKQFKFFVDEKVIDLELLQIDSSATRFSEIYSLKEKKYCYSNHELILKLKYFFFSDQSGLYYIEHFKDKYDNLYDLLTNENVKFEYFENYQKETIESLIRDNYLVVNNEKDVVLNNHILIYIIGEFHKKEVISYWNYHKNIRDEIDELIVKGLVITENTLFTKQEINYLNYYLNKKEFTNGFDLRNKYLHGTNSLSEKDHIADYYKLIKIIILTLLKIDDDIDNQNII
ncbi:hypothetical protein VB776_06200 [Arcicella sp. DC2W]|uniref:DUF4209 domain-containing protein n=1 Tax=Arcicella gelida TaxID=2984195 RepID=A0ABU5S232_9BACT|nr:hypothetical protein [Arcicella sp. DC2W]MEA5402497.1 hypothetical protein [Arcicella sp. DC2W]